MKYLHAVTHAKAMNSSEHRRAVEMQNNDTSLKLYSHTSECNHARTSAHTRLQLHPQMPTSVPNKQMIFQRVSNQRVAHVFICFYCVTLKHTQLIGSVVSSAGNQSGNSPIHPQHTHRPFQFSVEFLSAYLFLLFFLKILPPVVVIRARLLNLPGRCRQKQNQPSCRELTETS